MAPPLPPSIYSPSSVQSACDALGLPPPPAHVAAALAADVEYRIRDLVQGAAAYMRHAKRSQLTTADLDRAMREKNVEALCALENRRFGGKTSPYLHPIYGFLSPSRGHSSTSALASPSFRRVQTPSGPMHVLNDVEIDLETLPSRVIPERGAGVGWAAHWLAIEGVQPAIPQNPVRPSAGVRPGAFAAPAPAQAASAEQGSATGKSASVKPLIKHVLSRELQLYFERIVSSLLAAPLPPAPDTAAASTSADTQLSATASSDSAREAALAALRGDAGLAQLLPYLVQWVGEQTTAHLSDAQALSVVLRTAEALLHNSTLVIEPYLHQLLPSLLSVLLSSTLPATPLLRTHAAALLRHIVAQHSSSYPSLRPRLLRTLRAALQTRSTPAGQSAATKTGAVLGVRGLGKEAVKKVLVQQETMQALGEWCSEKEEEAEEVQRIVLETLSDLAPTYASRRTPANGAASSALSARVGDFWAQRLTRADAAQARDALLTLLADEAEENLDAEGPRRRLEAGQEQSQNPAAEPAQEQEADGDDTEMALL